MAQNQAQAKNFDFKNILTEFIGYISSYDRTKVTENSLVQGSLNVFRNIAGNIQNRPGKKLYSPADTASAPVNSEYVWNTGSATYIVQVANELLQVLIDGVWVTLASSVEGTRWVFDKWWDPILSRDYLIGVNGTNTVYTWSGGVTTIESVSTTAISLLGQASVLNAPVTMTGTATDAAIIPYLNPFSGAEFNGSLVGVMQPTNGQTIFYSLPPVSPITITFVTTIGATEGNVLIGPTIADTMTNLLGLLNNPGTTNATQVALSGPNATAVATATYAATSTITKEGTGTWAEAGFTSGGNQSYQIRRLIINGVTYTYGGGAYTRTLNGISPTPAGLVAGTQVLQSVASLDFSTTLNFEPDFVKVIDNQAYYGMYTSQTCYISAADDFTDLTPIAASVKGSPANIVFDSLLRGITVRSGKPCIGLQQKWGVINFSYTTTTGTDAGTYRITTIDYTPVAAGAGPYAHEFIDLSGDNIIYLSSDQQVRTFGNFNNSFTSNNFPVLSQEIYTELEQQDFTGGGLKCIGDIIYVTAPEEGTVFMRRERIKVNENGQTVNDIGWFAPFDWNFTKIDAVNDEIIGFSNVNPQIYTVWDTGIWQDEDPSGEFFAYNSNATFAYRTVKNRALLQSFCYLFTEGYINPMTTLTVTNKYNYAGSEDVLTQVVNSTTYPATYFPDATTTEDTEVGSLGDFSLGDETLGLSGATGGIPKFKVINNFSEVNCFEYQIIYSSEAKGDRWELLATATNAVETEQQSTFLISQQ